MHMGLTSLLVGACARSCVYHPPSRCTIKGSNQRLRQHHCNTILYALLLVWGVCKVCHVSANFVHGSRPLHPSLGRLPTDDHAYEARKEKEKELEEERRGAAAALSHNEFMYI